MKKMCQRCKRRLELTEFNWKYQGKRRASYCKNCSRDYIRKHYKRSRNYYLEKARKRNLKIRKSAQKFLGSYLMKHPCFDCGEENILVLEFDHKEKIGKDGEVSRIIRRTGSLKRMKEEIEKCDVRCANCHRIKTQKERKSWKLKYAPVA